MIVRKPVCAGVFYPAGEQALRKLVEDCFTSSIGPGKLPSREKSPEGVLAGLISPHAGLIYSGPVAAHGFLALSGRKRPGRVIILGPNHRGMGAALALSASAEWVMPMGNARIDQEGKKHLLEESSLVEVDECAHVGEHSIEVQLPFLQYLYGGDLAILPISMQWLDTGPCRELGRDIARAFSPAETVIVASSDFTHYEPQETVNAKDKLALRAIESLDAAGLVAAVEKNAISACGIGPIVAMLEACLIWGARSGKVLNHSTSGDICGDYSQVVGYASVAVSVEEN